MKWSRAPIKPPVDGATAAPAGGRYAHLRVALKAYRGYIFLRGEYIEAAGICAAPLPKRLKRGCSAKTLGNRFRFRTVRPYRGRALHLREETALINSLEGRRANPRSKHHSRQLPAYGANRPVSTTSKPV